MSVARHTLKTTKEGGQMELHTPESFNGARLVGTFENGSPEWHEARKDSLGGSEIGVAMGLSPFQSPFNLWAIKTGQIEAPKLNNWAIRFGNKFEQPILELLQEEHPDWELYNTGTYRHGERSFMTANPDALAKVNGEWVIVEVKTSRNYWHEIPPTYISQVRYYMAVMGVKRAVIVGVVNMAWVEHWVERDEFEEQVLIDQATRFWKYVTEGTQPDWDGSESTYETLRELHPDITDEEVEIDGIHNLSLAAKAYEEAEAELRKQKSQVMALMGKAKHAYIEHEGEKIRVATREARGRGRPYLKVVK
jgi:putative phage-type endonuclease